jgi:hypothetical protein
MPAVTFLDTILRSRRLGLLLSHGDAAEALQDGVNPGFDAFMHISHDVGRSVSFEFTRFVPSVTV